MAHRYILGADDSEHARLLAVCEMRRPQAELLFERLGIGLGQRVVDVGCGPLGVLDVLSARVGPTGEVVGLDNEPLFFQAWGRKPALDRSLGRSAMSRG